MTFLELEKRLGLKLVKEEWHQHPNGGGWVQNTASVEEAAFIGPRAIVSDKARVSGVARVSGEALVSGEARVSGDAQVSGEARVSGKARVSGEAQVSGVAWVSGEAQVSGGCWEQSPLYVVGTAHDATNAINGHIQIGCECHPFDWWLQNGEALARSNNYTNEQIEEYRAIVDLFIKIGK